MEKSKKRIMNFLVEALLVLFLFSIIYINMPPQIMGHIPWLKNACFIYLAIAGLLFLYCMLRDVWFILKPPTPWQKYADDDKGAKGL